MGNWFSFLRPATAQINAPDKPLPSAPSTSSDVNTQTRNFWLFTTWTTISLASLGLKVTSQIVGAATPVTDVEVGPKGGGGICSLIEVVFCLKSAREYYNEGKEIAEQKVLLSKGAEAFKESIDRTKAKSKSIELTPNQKFERAKNASLFVKLGNLERKEKKHREKRMSTLFSFFRDGPLVQMGSTGVRGASMAKTIGDIAGTTVQVSAPAAGIAASIFGIISSLFQIAQGIHEYRQNSKDLKEVGEISEQLNTSLNDLKFANFDKFRSANESNEVTKLAANIRELKQNPATKVEAEHLEALYGHVMNRVDENHDKANKALGKLKYQSKLRVILGTSTFLLAAVGLGLTISGVGLAIGVPTLASVGAAIGLAWLARTARNAWIARRKLNAADNLKQNQLGEIKALPYMSLADLEILQSKDKNPYVTVEMLIRHLQAGKTDASGNISTAGLKARRMAAGRALETAGMPAETVKALKQMLAVDGQNLQNYRDTVFKEIENFVIGDAGRVLFKLNTDSAIV
ncbi:hypothetical protein FNU76_01555 [Chitinimonas arctica]|uniref:Uncharacterized protein n=1 Tax=Chitinimonas arctica TaxID=2594795 RepID=A0A516SAH0_9NEIS|nr:hypothetical protein [Chitinimonas arctica]QDQ25146.1 hypothetical protein FNU76_01555 [Chitinimonas arctica]